MTHRTTRNDLIVHNAENSVTAEDLTFEVTAVGDTDFLFDGPDGPVTLHPGSRLSWRLAPMRRGNVQITAAWHECEQERTRTWTIAL